MNQKFSKYFNLSVPDENIEFFDIDIWIDTKRFVDPFRIAKINTKDCNYLNKIINVFMYELLTLIRQGKLTEAFKFCSFLNEPSGTRLGYSKIKHDGSGAGKQLTYQFIESLIASEVVKDGTLQHIEELSIFCRDIGKDRISDITIDVVKHGLIMFTQQQCLKYSIPMKKTQKKLRYFCVDRVCWVEDYFELPHVNLGSKEEFIILIPKPIVQKQVIYNHRYFYTNVAMQYYEAEAIEIKHSAVKKLKNGKTKVLAKELRLDPQYKDYKENMEKLILQHPESLELFRRIFARKIA